MQKTSASKLIQKAQSLQKAGKLLDAKTAYQTVLNIYPGNIRAKKELQLLNDRIAKHKLPVIPEKTKIRTLLDLYKNGKYHHVIDLAQRLLSTRPDQPFLWNILGASLIEQGEFAQAAKAFSKSIHNNPQNSDGYNNLGSAFHKMGNLEKAISCFQKAISIKSDHLAALCNLGIALCDQDDLVSSCEFLERAVEIDPSKINLHINLGNTLSKMGKYDSAICAYESALRLDPANSQALVNLSSIFLEKNELGDASKTLQKALLANPGSAVIAAYLAALPPEVIPKKVIDRVAHTFDQFARTQLSQDKYHFLHANILRHRCDQVGFQRAIKIANELKYQSVKDLEDADHAIRQDCLARLLNWKPSHPKIYEHHVKTLFILGPSRSGKSSLEKLLASNLDVRATHERINPKFDLVLHTHLKSTGSKAECDFSSIFEKIFFETKQDLNAANIKLVTCTAPAILRHLDTFADTFPNSFFVFMHRDRYELASDIFHTDYAHRNYYAYNVATIDRYLNWYDEVVDVVIKKKHPRMLKVDYTELANRSSAVSDELRKFVCMDL